MLLESLGESENVYFNLLSTGVATGLFFVKQVSFNRSKVYFLYDKLIPLVDLAIPILGNN